MISPKKVGYFASSKNIGFTYHLSRLALSTTKCGALEYTFITDEIEQREGLIDDCLSDGVALEIIPGLEQKGRYSFKFIREAVGAIASNNFNILHTQTNYQLMLAIIVKVFTGVKIIHTIHAFNNNAGFIKKNITKYSLILLLYTYAVKVFVPSQFVLKEFSTLRKRVKVLNLGYEAELASPQCGDVSIDDGKLKVIYCAKFHEAKNHAWLINALKSLIDTGRVQLILPGDGTQLADIQMLCEKVGYDHKSVYLPGWLDQNKLSTLYSLSDVGVVPSSSETFGHNIIEPLFFSVPVVSFPVGVALDINAKHKAVQLVGFFDEQAFLTAVHSFSVDPEMLSLAKQESRKIYENSFSWGHYINSFEKEIELL